MIDLLKTAPAGEAARLSRSWPVAITFLAAIALAGAVVMNLHCQPAGGPAAGVSDNAESLKVRKALDAGDRPENLELELTIRPSRRTTPGYYLDWTARNDGNSPIYIGPNYGLKIMDPDGRVSEDFQGVRSGTPVVVGPGTTKSFGGWFLNDRDQKPGRYGYQVQYQTGLMMTGPGTPAKVSNVVTAEFPAPPVEPTPPGDVWSDDANGLQVRVRADKRARAPDQTPTFHVDIRNIGDANYAVQLCMLNLDGAQYQWSGESAASWLGPGQERKDIPIALTDKWAKTYPQPVEPTKPTGGCIPLAPGRHHLGVLFWCQSPDSYMFTAETNPLEFEVANSQPATQPARSASSIPSTGSGQAGTRPSTGPELVGPWEGRARIIVDWCKQQSLKVALDIASDGRVTGTVGDARLRDATVRSNRGAIGRALKLATDLIIRGRLDGPIVAAEGIRRDAVSMPFNLVNGQIRGGLATSGWMFGGKESMVFTAAGMVLTRGPATRPSGAPDPNSATASAPSTRSGPGAPPAGAKLVVLLVDEQGKPLTNQSIEMMPVTVGCPQAPAGGPCFAPKDGTVTIESVSPGEHRYLLEQGWFVPTIVTLQVPPAGLRTKVVVKKGDPPGGWPDVDIKAKVHEENGKRTVDVVVTDNPEKPYDLKSTDLQLVSGGYRIFPRPAAAPPGETVPAKSKGSLQLALDWDEYVHSGLWVSRDSEPIDEFWPITPAGKGLDYYRVEVGHCSSLPVALPKVEEIQGRVIDHVGKGVSGATVYLASNQQLELCNGQAGQHWFNGRLEPLVPFNGFNTVADKDGQFALTGVGGDRLVVVAGEMVWMARMQMGKEQTIQLPQPGTVTISYDIEGAAKEGVFRLELKTWDMPDWRGVVQTSRYVKCKNGGTVEAAGLEPGEYDASRWVENFRVGDMGHCYLLDRGTVKVEAGKAAKLEYVRNGGSPVMGQLEGLQEANMPGAFIQVRSEKATGGPDAVDEWKLPLYAALTCGVDGAFKTERLEPGTYTVVAEAYRPLSLGEQGTLGWRGPTLIGTAKVTVPEQGAPPVVKIALKSRLPQPAVRATSPQAVRATSPQATQPGGGR